MRERDIVLAYPGRASSTMMRARRAARGHRGDRRYLGARREQDGTDHGA
jgi:hypothetical protein